MFFFSPSPIIFLIWKKKINKNISFNQHINPPSMSDPKQNFFTSGSIIREVGEREPDLKSEFFTFQCVTLGNSLIFLKLICKYECNFNMDYKCQKADSIRREIRKLKISYTNMNSFDIFAIQLAFCKGGKQYVTAMQ